MKYFETLAQDIGKWQLLTVLVAGIAVMNMAPSHLAMPFYAPKHDHWCSFPDNFTSSDNSNITKFMNEDSCDISILKGQDDSSSIILNNRTDEAETYKCTSWKYDPISWKRTVVSDFDLVCSRDVLISTSSFVYMIGLIAGVSIFGPLSDKYGRKLISNIVNALWVLVSIITAFSVNYIMFTIMRFMVAACAIASMTTTYVWCMESLGNKGRSIFATLLSIIWSFGMLAITAISYFTRDWFMSQIIASILVALYFLFAWATVESPSWLFSVGRFDDGMKALRSAAKMNGKLAPDESLIIKEMEDGQTPNNESASLLDLFKHPNLRKNTLILYYNWFVVSFIYYAMTLNTGDLGGDLFVNMTISSVLEGIGYMIAIVLLITIGRRLSTAFCFIISGIFCFLVAFIPSSSESLEWFKVSIALIGRTTISISFNNLFLYTSELQPTVVRNIGLGSSTMVSRIGGMLAPYVKELSKYTNSSVPMILFGILATTSGAVGLLLPETKDKILPNTIEEGEAFGKVLSKDRKKWFSCFKKGNGIRKDISLQEVALH